LKTSRWPSFAELFTVEKVHSSPARFDMKKLEAINGDKIRALTLDEFLSVVLALP
jgi:glutamyl/glutaminyl-tRNA synthetase